MPRITPVLLIATAATLVACSKPANPDNAAPTKPGAAIPMGPANPLIESATFAEGLKVDLKASTRSASGLYYRDVVVGTGPTAVAGKFVTAKYDGTLADGTRFDAGSYRFQLGAHAVIPGWDEGLAGMKVGGTRQLVVPPDLGYGPNGNPPRIPGSAILVFTVELVGVQ